MLLHDESGVKARPNLDLVGIQAVSLCRVERLPPNDLKLESSHQ